MIKYNYTLAQLPEIAAKLIETSKSRVLLFYGKMGVGKTTLIKEIAKQLGVEERVSSPTFSLVNEYLATNGETIYHFDFYRIKDADEALDFGIEEYFSSQAWCLIEWPEKVKNLLPLKAIEITLTENLDRTRTVTVKK